MQRKPLDVGDGTVCASLGLDGSLLSVGASRPVVGLFDPVYGVVRIISTRADALSGEPSECAA